VKTATKLLKMKKKAARKIQRELGGILIVLARLEAKRVKLLKATAERIEGLKEADIACPE
jgi:GTP cyclohydrolase II